MTWTAPPDFVAGNVVTEAQLDTLSQDLNHLLNGFPISKVVRNNSANYTTTSTSFVDVDATNLILTMTLTGGWALVIVTFTATAAASGDGSEFDIIVDSTTRAGDATHGLARLWQGAGGLPVIAGYFSGLSVGSHTFKLQYRSISAGTTTINANAGAATTTFGSVVTMIGWGS